MNTEVEPGQNCEAERGRIDGDGNSKLTSPLEFSSEFYTGETVLGVWSEICELLEKAAAWSHAEYQTADILVKATSGLMQIWIFREGGKIRLVGVTELLTYPRKRTCNIYALAGSGMVAFWERFSKTLFVWLETHGILEIETSCRDEVMTKLLRLGFTKKTNVLHFHWKELS